MRAKSRMVSWPVRAEAGSMSTAQPSVGSTPNSVLSRFASSIEQAEKRTDHPQGSSEENGIPEPPPVVAPTTFTPGRSFMIDTKLLAAENVERLARTTTGLPQRIRPTSAGL